LTLIAPAAFAPSAGKDKPGAVLAWRGADFYGRSRKPARGPVMSITVYGITNCDTVKKARGWLDGLGLAYRFHDYKKSGADRDKLAEWVEARGWEAILNRKGPTFRKLPESDRADLDGPRAIALMENHTSAIRRPIVEYSHEDGTGLLVGFDAQEWSTALGGALT
jgi:Spx/MgsR family transcriptional regulator